MRPGTAIASFVLAVGVLAGCGTASTPSGSWSSAVPVFGVAASDAPVLADPPSQGLVATDSIVTPGALGGETTVADLTQALSDAGFVGGRQRTFQGPSKDLSLVVSRALVFDSAQGATRFLDWVHASSDGLFGLTTEVEALRAGARTGYVFRAPECACPGAQPRLVAVVRDGRRIDWLTINGPQATRSRLDTLLGAPTS